MAPIVIEMTIENYKVNNRVTQLLGQAQTALRNAVLFLLLAGALSTLGRLDEECNPGAGDPRVSHSTLLVPDEPPRVMRRLDPLGGWSHDRTTTPWEVSRRAA